MRAKSAKEEEDSSTIPTCAYVLYYNIYIYATYTYRVHLCKKSAEHRGIQVDYSNFEKLLNDLTPHNKNILLFYCCLLEWFDDDRRASVLRCENECNQSKGTIKKKTEKTEKTRNKQNNNPLLYFVSRSWAGKNKAERIEYIFRLRQNEWLKVLREHTPLFQFENYNNHSKNLYNIK